MKYLLLHATSLELGGLTSALAAEDITVRAISSANELNAGHIPTALLLHPDSRTLFGQLHLQRFTRDGGGVVALGAAGEKDPPDDLTDDVVSVFVPHPHGRRQLLLALRTAYREAAARADALNARTEAASRTRELSELTHIGMALTTEHDYNTLLDLILTQARKITNSDAGSLYLVEKPEGEPRQLRFKLSQNMSRPDIPFVEYTMPIDISSIAGNAATTGHPLVIDDVYDLGSAVEYTFNRSFDEKYGYRSKSMLTIPMKDHKNEVIGVLQLINRKRHGTAKLTEPEDFRTEIISYSQRQVDLVSALAGQAAVSIENSQLYEDIERLFEGFVLASVTAIEQRDPTTFGHSGRVASMTVALAGAVDKDGDGAYRNVKFARQEIREIRYAGLLHDFGKVGVREQVLVKAKKLYPPDLALIRLRHAFIHRTAEGEFHLQRLRFLETHGREGYEEYARRLEEEHRSKLDELDRFLHLVSRSNEPTVLPEGSFDDLLHYANRYYQDLEGTELPYLTDDEVRFLSIRKGSLDESERLEIQSHVTHTYRFLLQIPWTKELQSIPKIAYGHHEKLDGSGYPRRIRGDYIPIQTRMMTISDIFDALTAADRPYKRAVPVPKALDILAEETNAGMLDPGLFKLFVDARVFEKASESGDPTSYA